MTSSEISLGTFAIIKKRLWWASPSSGVSAGVFVESGSVLSLLREDEGVRGGVK